MKKYSDKTQEQVHKTMHKMKEGTLKSSSGDKVKSREQAVAIALSEAREKGYKVPPQKTAAKKNDSRKNTSHE